MPQLSLSANIEMMAMSLEEIKTTIAALTVRRDYLVRDAMSNLRYGDIVRWNTRKRVSGFCHMTVERVNEKSVSGLECDEFGARVGSGGKWKVHPSLLTKVEKATKTVVASAAKPMFTSHPVPPAPAVMPSHAEAQAIANRLIAAGMGSF